MVTGASSGIGRRIANDLAERGAVVVGLARRAELLRELEELLRSHTPDSATRCCDMAEPGSYEAVLSELERAHGRIDILINNAGTERRTTVEDGADPYRKLFEVNFFAVVQGTLAVLPGMLQRHEGTIVNVSSDSCRAPEPGHGAYASSKAAVAVFTESVAHEVADKGVHVHALYPAWVPTAMGLSGVSDGGDLPPRAVRRSEAQVSALLLQRMGGRRTEINASLLPLLAPLGKTIAPVPYQQAVRRRARAPGAS